MGTELSDGSGPDATAAGAGQRKKARGVPAATEPGHIQPAAAAAAVAEPAGLVALREYWSSAVGLQLLRLFYTLHAPLASPAVAERLLTVTPLALHQVAILLLAVVERFLGHLEQRWAERQGQGQGAEWSGALQGALADLLGAAAAATPFGERLAAAANAASAATHTGPDDNAVAQPAALVMHVALVRFAVEEIVRERAASWPSLAGVLAGSGESASATSVSAATSTATATHTASFLAGLLQEWALELFRLGGVEAQSQMQLTVQAFHLHECARSDARLRDLYASLPAFSVEPLADLDQLWPTFDDPDSYYSRAVVERIAAATQAASKRAAQGEPPTRVRSRWWDAATEERKAAALEAYISGAESGYPLAKHGIVPVRGYSQRSPVPHSQQRMIDSNAFKWPNRAGPRTVLLSRRWQRSQAPITDATAAVQMERHVEAFRQFKEQQRSQQQESVSDASSRTDAPLAWYERGHLDPLGSEKLNAESGDEEDDDPNDWRRRSGYSVYVTSFLDFDLIDGAGNVFPLRMERNEPRRMDEHACVLDAGRVWNRANGRVVADITGPEPECIEIVLEATAPAGRPDLVPDALAYVARDGGPGAYDSTGHHVTLRGGGDGSVNAFGLALSHALLFDQDRAYHNPALDDSFAHNQPLALRVELRQRLLQRAFAESGVIHPLAHLADLHRIIAEFDPAVLPVEKKEQVRNRSSVTVAAPASQIVSHSVRVLCLSSRLYPDCLLRHVRPSAWRSACQLSIRRSVLLFYLILLSATAASPAILAVCSSRALYHSATDPRPLLTRLCCWF